MNQKNLLDGFTLTPKVGPLQRSTHQQLLHLDAHGFSFRPAGNDADAPGVSGGLQRRRLQHGAGAAWASSSLHIPPGSCGNPPWRPDSRRTPRRSPRRCPSSSPPPPGWAPGDPWGWRSRWLRTHGPFGTWPGWRPPRWFSSRRPPCSPWWRPVRRLRGRTRRTRSSLPPDGRATGQKLDNRAVWSEEAWGCCLLTSIFLVFDSPCTVILLFVMFMYTNVF